MTLRPRRPSGRFDRATRWLLAAVIGGSAAAAAAAVSGGALHRLGETAIAGLDTLSIRSGLVVREVRTPGVSGRGHARLVDASGVIPGITPAYRADPESIRDRLRNATGIDRVRVLRRWPNQLLIVVDPRHPAALHEIAGAPVVVDRFGNPIPGTSAADHPGLPRLTGALDGRAIDTLLTDLKRHPRLSLRLSRAERIGGRRWDLVLKSGTRLMLPEDGRHRASLARAARLHAGMRLLDVERADFRVIDRLILRRTRGEIPAGNGSGFGQAVPGTGRGDA